MDESCAMDFSYTAYFSSLEESYSASVDYDNITEYFPELDDTMLEPGLSSPPFTSGSTVAGMIDPALLTQHQGFENLPHDAPPIQHH
jgi:hypothetical protein